MVILPSSCQIYEIPIILSMYNRLSISNQSFFLSTITFVNSLDLGISRYFESFKYRLKQNYVKDAMFLSYYDIRCRYLIIVHTEIKNSCSALHNDLFHADLIPNPSCSSWYYTENAEQFCCFFLLDIFAQRHILLRLRFPRLYILT